MQTAAGAKRTADLPLGLRANTLLALLAYGSYAGFQWGLVMLLAKLGNAEQVGLFALGSAISVPVFMLTNVALGLVQATDTRDEYAFQDLLGVRLIGSTVGVLLIAVLAALGWWRTEAYGIVVAVAVWRAAESVGEIHLTLFQKHERMDRVATSMMLKGAGALFVVGATFAMTANLLLCLGLLVAWWGGVVLVYDRAQASDLLGTPAVPSWNPTVARRLVRLSWPLALGMTLVSLNAYVPRYTLEHCCGARALGYFAAVGNLPAIGMLGISALGQSATPRLARLYLASRSSFDGLVVKLSALALLIGIAAIAISAVAGQQILSLIYTEEYNSYTDLLLWVAIASTATYMAAILGFAGNATRQFGVLLTVYLAVSAVTVLASFSLVSTFGLLGAAWVGLLGSLVQILLLAGLLSRRVMGPRGVKTT